MNSLHELLTLTKTHHIKAERCRRRFSTFVQEFWDIIIPEKLVWNWHMQYLCDELQEIGERVAKRLPKDHDLIINIPPGTTKSTICTIMFPAWLWTIDATIRNLTASYSAAVSTDHAVKSRDIIKSDRYRQYFPEILIKADQDNKTHFKNTKGGDRFSTSVGGSATGQHAHVIIIDDPLNPKEAVSDADREKANHWIDQTLSTRKVDKSVTVTITVMQRLHESDPTGYQLKKKKKNIKHICLPARISDDVTPPELKENYVDNLLDPLRLSDAALKDLEIDLGSYGAAGQLQQRPSPAGGGIWQKWFIEIPDDQFPAPSKMQKYGTDWDLAYTDDDDNAASAYITGGKIGETAYIDWVDWEHFEFPDLIKWMKKQADPHYIEAKASGKSAKQTLKKMGIPAIEVKVIGGDKEARARMATPIAEAGMVCIRKSQADKLYNDSEQGILKFPKGKKDAADALAQFIQRLLGKPVVKKPRVSF